MRRLINALPQYELLPIGSNGEISFGIYTVEAALEEDTIFIGILSENGEEKRLLCRATKNISGQQLGINGNIVVPYSASIVGESVISHISELMPMDDLSNIEMDIPSIARDRREEE